MIEGWIKTELGDKKYFDILGSGIQFFENEKDYLSTSSVIDDKIDHVEQRITFIKRPSRANMQPIKNSVWFAKMKETLKVILIDDKIIKNNILSTGFCGIKCIDVSPELLKQFFMSKKFNSKKDLLSEGSTQKAINNTKTATIEITFPESLPEQQKIADILTKVDETIEATEKIIVKDERIKKGLMQDLFSKGIDEKGNLRSEETHEFKDSELGRIPKEWDVETLSPNFAKITTGNKDTQDRNNDGLYPFFVRSNTIERINSYSYDGEAILTSGDGVGVGKIYHYVNCKFDFHQRVYMLYNFKKDISGKYLFYYFRENFYNEIAKDSAKTTVDSVRLHMIADMKIPKPKLQEQEKIASILSSIDSKIQKEKQELNKLKSIKEGLMQDLLTGNKQKEVTCMIKEAVV